MGDFNAKFGNINEDKTPNRGNFGLGAKNARKENYFQNKNLYGMNSFFPKIAPRRWTWISPDKETKHEIDYFQQKYVVKDVSVLHRFNTGSDHRLLRATIEINVQLERKKLIQPNRLPTLEQLDENLNKYQEELRKKIHPKGRLTELEINEFKQDIKTVTKKISFNRQQLQKPNAKLKKDTLDLLKQRR